MTTSIQKRLPTQLEQEYARLRNHTGENRKAPRSTRNAAAEPGKNPDTDTVTLSSEQPDNGAPSKLKRSQSVTPVEKQALQAQLSIRA